MLQNLVWFFARRFTLLIGSLVTASALVFFLLRTLPGDLASLKLGVDANPEALTQVRQEFGLDKSLVAQYLDWVANAAQGDLGVSMLTGADISQEILNKATVTLPLIGLASVLAILFAVPLGMYSALNFRNRRGIGV
ncbi:MAG: ABC transporter permease, partial [Actinomycetota bacterium]|nr:ABC transporter permease [Actinomycetota bacterium]